LGAQLLVALELGLAEGQLGRRRALRRPGRLLRQCQVAGVQPGQRLSGLDRVAEPDLSPQQLTTHPEAQPQLAVKTPVSCGGSHRQTWPRRPQRRASATDNQRVSVDHYENFPVASLLCPPHMRAGVTAVYHFARTADDIADEGEASAEVRRISLAQYRQALDDTLAARPVSGAWAGQFTALGAAIRRHQLPPQLLHDLLDAFVQDTGNPRYADRAELLDYCRRSANPVGRLLLHMAGVHGAAALAQSDAICSALQLINFWQDPSIDLPRGRHYVSLADAQAHGLQLDDLAQQADSAASQALMAELCAWAAELMRQGAPLALQVPGRLGWELRLVVQGGLRILERIAAMQYRTLHQRPVLRAIDLPVMLWRALRMRAGQPLPGFALPGAARR